MIITNESEALVGPDVIAKASSTRKTVNMKVMFLKESLGAFSSNCLKSGEAPQAREKHIDCGSILSSLKALPRQSIHCIYLSVGFNSLCLIIHGWSIKKWKFRHDQ
jgi:hypothetical protein